MDTGFNVLPNVPVRVTGSGAVNCGPWFCVGVGPDGASLFTTDSSFLVAGVPAWGLVGRIGTGPWVQVGSGPTTLSGHLEDGRRHTPALRHYFLTARPDVHACSVRLKVSVLTRVPCRTRARITTWTVPFGRP